MGSLDRRRRQKEVTRSNILEAAFAIIKKEGWEVLTMKKIAVSIEYTAAAIYAYFPSKDAILQVFADYGFLKLSIEIQHAREYHTSPANQLKAMWLAYYNFAFSEKELYQVMFGVGMASCEYFQAIKEEDKAREMLLAVISEIISDHRDGSSNQEVRLFYTFWAFIHGAVSLTIMHRRNPDELTLNLVTQAINAILESMQHKNKHLSVRS